eukprot:COSAG05_NODE_34_length_27784_cov_62.890129_11_plen_63_part_00
MLSGESAPSMILSGQMSAWYNHSPGRVNVTVHFNSLNFQKSMLHLGYRRRIRRDPMLSFVSQ